MMVAVFVWACECTCEDTRISLEEVIGSKRRGGLSFSGGYKCSSTFTKVFRPRTLFYFPFSSLSRPPEPSSIMVSSSNQCGSLNNVITRPSLLSSGLVSSFLLSSCLLSCLLLSSPLLSSLNRVYLHWQETGPVA